MCNIHGDNDPVIYLETKYGYDREGEAPDEEYAIPLGKADIKREGKPVVRVGAAFTPLPRKPYEKLYLPDKEKIVCAVKGILG